MGMKTPTLNRATLFRHNFDIGDMFYLLKDNGDGTGDFVEWFDDMAIPSPNRPVRYTKPREVRLSFSEVYCIS